MSDLRFGIIADDFTGAMDTGAQFAGVGQAVRVSLDGHLHADDAVVVLTTDSRELDASTASTRAAAAAQALRGRRLFKKIDSTLRGHVGCETLAVLAISGAPKAVLCPAVPAAGRVVRAGQLWVNDRLLHQSALAADPGWPAHTSDVAARVGGDAVSLSLSVLRGPNFAAAVQASPARLLLPDAETEADLARIAGLFSDGPYLPCGALALARAWLLALDAAPTPASAPRLSGGPFVLACGSANPAARHLAEQIAHQTGAIRLTVSAGRGESLAAAVQAVQRGLPVLLQAAAPDQGGSPALLAEAVEQVCARCAPTGLLLMGGETARAVLQAIRAASVWVQGQLAPGLAWGQIDGGLCHQRWIVTQSGGLSAAASLPILADCLLDFCQ